MEALSFKGRWVCLSSLRSYLQEGAARLVWARLAQAQQLAILRLLERAAPVLAAPPPAFDCWPERWMMTR